MTDTATLAPYRQLIDAGFRIIPVVAESKRPALAGWTDPDYTGLGVDELARWFSGDTPHSVGILTGIDPRTDTGLFVVDVDDKNDSPGWANWKAWCAAHHWDADRVPGCLGVVKTPGGRGFHLYFRYDPAVGAVSNANTLPEGVDVRGEGGYVVAPPSRGYEWQ